MKKTYISPELDLIKLTLTRDILGDSKIEQTDNPHIDSSDPGELGGWD